jgi:release factor glutamine methyltransferase
LIIRYLSMVRDEPSGRVTEVTAALRAAGCVFAEDEAALLVAAADDDAALDRLVARRVAGEPLEQVLGWAELDGVRVSVAPGVFVPRRRTRVVVRHAARAVRARLAAGGPALVVDLCCGTGAVGTALLARLGPDAARVELHAADVDPAAVACARSNLPTAHVHEGDLWDALPARLAGAVDVAAVNAPYVPTQAIATMPPEAREHEPATALDGGPDGLDLHRRLAAGAARWLAPGGVVVLETSGAQASASRAALAGAGLAARVVRDAGVGGTAVVATRPGRAAG